MRRTTRRTRPVTNPKTTNVVRRHAARVVPEPDIPPSIEERLERARRIVNVAAGALDGYDAMDLTGGDVEQLVGDVRESLRGATLELFYLSKLGADVLNRPAPDRIGD